MALVHVVAPFNVDTLEAFGLIRKLLHDISRVKDRLQVGPCTLASNPLLERI